VHHDSNRVQIKYENLLKKNGVVNFMNDLSFSLYAMLIIFYLVTTSDNKDGIER